ncbi:MAG: ATP-binding protein [Saprospiraceae bacterium]|nr:ATP-binding protein [Lewinella sp.]
MSPFKFLDAYDKEDQDRFFGREKETAQLYNAVFASNLTLLYGGSGTGKTSLVNCGLANKFYPSDWLPVFVRRESNINLSLPKAIEQYLERGRPSDFTEWPLPDQVQRLYLDHYRPVYLIFDQFEELFILGSQTEQQEFYRSIAQLLKAGLQAKIILIVREEWIAHLNEFEKVLPTLFDNRLRIEQMNDRNIARVISGMTRQADHPTIKIEDPQTTISQIISNLRDKHHRVDLTNLQVYMDRLYRTRQANTVSGQTIVFDPVLVEQVGRIDNVLGTFLEEQMTLLEDKLSEKGVKQVKGLPLEILYTLVTDNGTKQQMEPTGIQESLPRNRNLSYEQLTYCLEEFQRLRLLRRLE